MSIHLHVFIVMFFRVVRVFSSVMTFRLTATNVRIKTEATWINPSKVAHRTVIILINIVTKQIVRTYIMISVPAGRSIITIEITCITQ